MELLYIWIASYKNIQNIGFNFSPKYQFDYSESEDNLLIKERQEIPNFFSDNICNVTAIIGENGVGKTNLLSFLIETFSYKENSDFKINQLHDFPNILFLYKNKKIAFFTIFSFKGEENLVNFNGFKVFSSIDNGKSQQLSMANLGWVYYNPSIDNQLVASRRYNYDISDMRYLIELAERDHKIDSIDIIGQFLSTEIKRVCNFLIDFQKQTQFNFIGNIPIPEYVFLTLLPCDEENLWEGFEKKDEELIKYLCINTEVYKWDLKSYNELYISGFILKRFLFNILCSLKNTPKPITKLLAFDDFYRAHPIEIDTSIEVVIRYLYDYIQAISQGIKHEKKLHELIAFIEQCYKKNHAEAMTDFFVIGLDLEEAQRMVTEDNYFYHIKQEIIEKYTGVHSFNIKPKLFYFSWRGLSFGQQKMLSLFARFFDFYISTQQHRVDIINDNNPLPKISDKITGIVLLIDEGELGFHPKWQKSYINNLVNGLSIIFKEKKVQIILTSHSPFVISDLPKNNIIFLKKDKKSVEIEQQHTFAANINTLFSDAFFMEHSLIGDFAKKKLEELIKDLSSLDTLENKGEKQKIQDKADKIIEIIGEPIIREKFRQLYQEKIKANDLDTQIMYHQKEVERLRKLKDSKND